MPYRPPTRMPAPRLRRRALLLAMGLTAAAPLVKAAFLHKFASFVGRPVVVARLSPRLIAAARQVGWNETGAAAA